MLCHISEYSNMRINNISEHLHTQDVSKRVLGFQVSVAEVRNHVERYCLQ